MAAGRHQQARLYPAVPRASTLVPGQEPPRSPLSRSDARRSALVPAFAITAASPAKGRRWQQCSWTCASTRAPTPLSEPWPSAASAGREDVLLLRRFPRWLFNRGAPEGPTPAAADAPRPEIDWAAYRDARRPKAKCQACHQARELTASHTNSGNGSAPTFLPPVTFAPEATSANSLLARDWSAANAALSRLQSLSRERSWRRKALKPKRQCLACVQQIQTLTCVDCEHDATKPAFAFDPSMLTLPATKPWSAYNARLASFAPRRRAARAGSRVAAPANSSCLPQQRRT